MFHLIFTLLPPPSFKHKPFFCSEDSNWDLYGPEDVENSRHFSLAFLSHDQIHPPPKFTSLPIRVTGTFLSLALSLSWKTGRELDVEDKSNWNTDLLINENGVVVFTTCLCFFTSAFLPFSALSTSADVSRPTVDELSWLNNLVCPENSWLVQSPWTFLEPVLPLQVPCPPFTLPKKQPLKQAPIVEYLWTWAAVTRWTCCHLLNVSWKTRRD